MDSSIQVERMGQAIYDLCNSLESQNNQIESARALESPLFVSEVETAAAEITPEYITRCCKPAMAELVKAKVERSGNQNSRKVIFLSRDFHISFPTDKASAMKSAFGWKVFDMCRALEDSPPNWVIALIIGLLILVPISITLGGMLPAAFELIPLSLWTAVTGLLIVWHITNRNRGGLRLKHKKLRSFPVLQEKCYELDALKLNPELLLSLTDNGIHLEVYGEINDSFLKSLQ